MERRQKDGEYGGKMDRQKYQDGVKQGRKEGNSMKGGKDGKDKKKDETWKEK
mgnify:CR=1 FL=1